MNTIKLPPLPASLPYVKVWIAGSESLEGANGVYYTDDHMRAYARQAIAAALEAAAGECEQSDEDGEGPDCWDWHGYDYAYAIRALKVEPPHE